MQSQFVDYEKVVCEHVICGTPCIHLNLDGPDTEQFTSGILRRR